MQRRIVPPSDPDHEDEPPVLSNRSFRLLWIAQVISQTAQNAILYGLIIVVLDLTESTTSTSGVILAFIIPIAVFGIFAGVLADRWSKRRLLILTNIGRAVCAIAFFFAREHVWALYGITAVFASFSQLFTTSSATSIPFIVSRKQLISANSLYSGGFTVAQIAGLIVLSPIILKTAGAGVLFILTAAIFLIASSLARFQPTIGEEGAEAAHGTFPGREELRGAATDFAEALRGLRSDAVSALAMGHLMLSSTLILLFAVLVPRYMQAILKVSPDDAVAVFAPVAIGALVGLRAVGLIVDRIGKVRTVSLGLFGIAACLAVMGFVELIASGLERTEHLNPFGTDPFFGRSILVSLTALIAGPMGFAYAMLNTPAQTTLHERTPIDMRGRVIASQMVLANGVALVPLVVVGGIADLYGVSTVILAISVFLVGASSLSVYLEHGWLKNGDTDPPTGGDPPSWDRSHGAAPDSN
ncbi:MAG: MFS transporter [Chloroflexi bacterium]|nr:MFS transporter [Chloroflexota bacterium]MCI0856979.1 MFS transporter [Chloroflexota bacterium]